jgi:hypothetical protein
LIFYGPNRCIYTEFIMTSFDVIGGIELTISAAILIAAISVVLGRDAAQRIRLAALLGAWFVVVVVLAATGALHHERGIGTSGLGLAAAVPILLIWPTLMRVSSLRQRLDTAPVAVLVGANVVRILGLSFLILHAGGRLPAPFAPVAGWGDILAGVTAVPVAWMVQGQTKGWRAILLAWNLFGLGDLIAAVSLGVLSAPGPLRRIFTEPGTGLMSTLPWMLIPAFLVPLLAMIHLAIFRRLSKLAHSVHSTGAQDGPVGHISAATSRG